MSAGLITLVATSVFFVGLHVVLSGTGLRRSIVRVTGERPFQGLFSVLAALGLLWMVLAYISVTGPVLWEAQFLEDIVLVVMPFALILAVAGSTTRNPMSVGQIGMLEADRSVHGIVHVTRHPINWGIAMWAGAHMLANGDVPSLIFFGALAFLAMVGSWQIDLKRKREKPYQWAQFSAQTSFVPLAALIGRRTRVSLGEIGWIRIVAALALYAILLGVHPWLFGESVIPGQ